MPVVRHDGVHLAVYTSIFGTIVTKSSCFLSRWYMTDDYHLNFQRNLEHEVERGLRVEAGLGVVEVILLEIRTPEPGVGVILMVEEVVDMEAEGQRRRFLHSLRSVEMTGGCIISSEVERYRIPYCHVSHEIGRNSTL